MKKILTLVWGLLLFFACSKQETQDNTLETVFENTNLQQLRSRPFNPILNDYTIKIEKIGYNNSGLETLKANKQFANVSKKFNLDLSNIRRHYYDHSPVVITFIPIKNQFENQMLVVYNLYEKYYFAITKETELSNGLKHFSLSSVSNTSLVFYEFQLAKNNSIGKFKSHSSPFIEFRKEEMLSSRAPLEVLNEDGIGGDGLDPLVKYGCCSKGFNDCMNCFVQSCGDDWRCFLICGLGAAYCLASWTISCSTGIGCNYPISQVPGPNLELKKDSTLIFTPKNP